MILIIGIAVSVVSAGTFSLSVGEFVQFSFIPGLAFGTALGGIYVWSMQRNAQSLLVALSLTVAGAGSYWIAYEITYVVSLLSEGVLFLSAPVGATIGGSVGTFVLAIIEGVTTKTLETRKVFLFALCGGLLGAFFIDAIFLLPAPAGYSVFFLGWQIPMLFVMSGPFFQSKRLIGQPSRNATSATPKRSRWILAGPILFIAALFATLWYVFGSVSIVLTWQNLLLPTQKDYFFEIVAADFGEASICNKISPKVVVDTGKFGGREYDYLRSRCYTNVAASTKNASLCGKATLLVSLDWGAGNYSKSNCLQRKASSVLSPLVIRDFVPIMEELGYDRGDVETSIRMHGPGVYDPTKKPDRLYYSFYLNVKSGSETVSGREDFLNRVQSLTSPASAKKVWSES